MNTGGDHLATKMVTADAKEDLDNYHTEQIGRCPATKDVSVETFQSLLEKVSDHVPYDRRFEWDANINGVLIRYVGNSRHQYDFWKENWWPGPNDDSILPHGKIFSVSGVPGEDPHAYYCPELNQALFVNTEYYGQCKSWALGMAAIVLEEKFNTHSIHGACAELDGHGIVIVAPTGTGKTTQVNKLFQHPKGRIIGDDWIYIKHPTNPDSEAPLVVTQPERSLYVRTENAEEEEWLRPIFRRCKLENVPMKDGEPQFWEFGNSRAIIPREWMLGEEKVADEAPMSLVVLLRRDEDSPAEVWLDPDEAVEVLREGKYQILPGAGPKEKWGTYDHEAWYNPYLLKPDHDRQAEFFRKEVESSACVLLNTGLEDETIDKTYQRIIDALKQVTGV